MKSNYSFQNYIQAALSFVLILTVCVCIAGPIAVSKSTDSKTTDNTEEDISQDEFVELQSDMDLFDLIKTISDVNGETYILDESVKPQKVNIITPEGGMKKEDFLKFFDVILNLNGLSVVKTGDINKVISSNRIKEESTPTIIELDQ